MKPNRLVDTGLIILSIVFSYLLSMSNPNLDRMEMDALLNFYFPGLFGLLLLILFLVFAFAFKNAYLRFRWPVVVSMMALVLLLGAWLHFIKPAFLDQ